MSDEFRAEKLDPRKPPQRKKGSFGGADPSWGRGEPSCLIPQKALQKTEEKEEVR